MLAGGDLDGDIYCLVMDRSLHPRVKHEPAPDNPAQPVTIDRPSTARDLAQFVVDFIKVRIWVPLPSLQAHQVVRTIYLG
jgi:hypothetical protein